MTNVAIVKRALSDRPVGSKLDEIARFINDELRPLVREMRNRINRMYDVSFADSADVTLTVSQRTMIVDDDDIGAEVTVRLPQAAINVGLTYTVKKIGASHNVVVNGYGNDTIDGSTTFTINAQYESITITATAYGWYIL